jgi:hypothetical protein
MLNKLGLLNVCADYADYEADNRYSIHPIKSSVTHLVKGSSSPK